MKPDVGGFSPPGLYKVSIFMWTWSNTDDKDVVYDIEVGAKVFYPRKG
jgi:hypothetical protein